VPLECPPAVQKGECHINFIRKQQCSFSWDWGPAFAPIGINGNVNLNIIKIFDFKFSVSVYPVQKTDLTSWTLDIDLEILNSDLKSAASQVLVVVEIEEIAFKYSEMIKLENIRSKTLKKLKVIVRDVDELKLWWPNGHGEQNLFKLIVQVHLNDSQSIVRSNSIGFRSVTLVQNQLETKNSKKAGLTFFFEINNRPIFLKG